MSKVYAAGKMGLKPIHPGRLLKEDIEALGLSITKAAEQLGVSRPMLSNIVNEKASITPEMAIKIGHWIGNGPSIWYRLQMEYDLRNAETQARKLTRGIKPAQKVA